MVMMSRFQMPLCDHSFLRLWRKSLHRTYKRRSTQLAGMGGRLPSHCLAQTQCIFYTSVQIRCISTCRREPDISLGSTASQSCAGDERQCRQTDALASRESTRSISNIAPNMLSPLQTDDTLWVIVFATEPAIVTLQRAYKFKIQPGVTKLSSPLHVDTGIDVKMTREVDSSVLAECSPSDFRFTHQPETYNFNAFVAMS